MTGHAEKASALLQVAQTQLGSGSRFEAVSAASVHAQLAQVEATTRLAAAVCELTAALADEEKTVDQIGTEAVARGVAAIGDRP
ncbi:hypothetical protein [Rhodococcus aetherivorans]|uniref:hypothetical protein n=1 Tax=Rhodococcus aetherivorans TaxID=191292 RepID=UPI0002D22F04|nr:hypothetical protein [Rhodococcus aetherivorans]CCW14638.1 hypothetical protein EBESD8_52080 [Rhodococcus aetherivorans]